MNGLFHAYVKHITSLYVHCCRSSGIGAGATRRSTTEPGDDPQQAAKTAAALAQWEEGKRLNKKIEELKSVLLKCLIGLAV